MILPQEQTRPTSVIRLVKRNQLSFLSIEINKPLLSPIHSVFQIRFKFRSQFKLLPQMGYVTTLRVDSSFISIDAISQITSSRRSLMYSRKSVGPKMEPGGTPALTKYSCEDFPSRTTRSCSLPRKEEIRRNT